MGFSDLDIYSFWNLDATSLRGMDGTVTGAGIAAPLSLVILYLSVFMNPFSISSFRVSRPNPSVLGFRPTVPSILTGIDPELIKPVERKMKEMGIRILLSAKVSSVEKSGSEYFAAVPKKVEKIVDLFKDMIPMG